MNNLKLRKKLQKINHACGDCGGYGTVEVIEESIGLGSYPDVDTCESCKGTGIDIPLEFGCTITVQEKYSEVPNPVPMIIISGRNGFGEFDTDRYERVKNEDVIKNLGKPSTMGDLMRALGAKDNQTTMFVDNGYLMILNDDLKRTWTKLDLSKTVETQTQEVINQLIEILK